MTKILSSYGALSSLFYELTNTYASQKEVAFYTSFLAQKDDKILEAMSGAGRLMVPLLKQGYHVEGVDNSSAMLERCKVRCASLKLNPALYEQSLERMTLPHQYALATICVGSFQLITNRASALQALKNIYAHMQHGGSLLIDFFIPEEPEDPYSEQLIKIDERRSLHLARHNVFDADKKLADAVCIYSLLLDGVVQQTEQECIRVTWYTDDALKALLEEAAFVVQGIYTEYFDDENPSYIVHAQKV
ncbi:MAG: class I SAM-dependent methyltransferase [Candidatus Babeliales bacterium]